MNRGKDERCRDEVGEDTWALNILCHPKTQHYLCGEPCADLLWSCSRGHIAHSVTFMPFQFHCCLFWPQICHDFLSNQIISAVLDLAGIWCWQILACPLRGCADPARPYAEMLLFCNHFCAEVWRWESRFQQCLILFSGVLWHFHQGSRWWRRDDPHYDSYSDCRSPKSKYKQNFSLPDHLSLKRSCQLGTTVVRNIIKLVRTLQLCVSNRITCCINEANVC